MTRAQSARIKSELRMKLCIELHKKSHLGKISDSRYIHVNLNLKLNR